MKAGMKSVTLDDEDTRVLHRFRVQKAQSGAMAQAVLAHVDDLRDRARRDPSLSDDEREQLHRAANLTARRARRQLSCAWRTRLDVKDVAPNVTERQFSREGFGCGRVLCMICARQKSRKLHRQLLTAYDRAHERLPGIRALELVLTQPASPIPDLGRGIDRLHQSVRKFLRTPDLQLATVDSFRRTEITFNASAETFHIHAHVVLIVPPWYFSGSYLTHKRLTALWAQILGVPGFVNVSIRAVGLRNAKGKLIEGTERQGLWHSTKYVTKPLEVFQKPDPETKRFVVRTDVAAAFEQGLFGRRMHAFAGILKSSWKAPAELTSRSPAAAGTATGACLPARSSRKRAPRRSNPRHSRKEQR